MNRFAVTLRRVIRAPRARVYRAFLDPELVAQWLAPGGSVVSTATVDERVGGVHRVDMIDEHGAAHLFDNVIQELVPDERIVLTFRFAPGAEDTLLTLTFRDAEGGGTGLRLQHERITHAPPLDTQSVDTGWSQALAKLAAFFDKE